MFVVETYTAVRRLSADLACIASPMNPCNIAMTDIGHECQAGCRVQEASSLATRDCVPSSKALVSNLGPQPFEPPRCSRALSTLLTAERLKGKVYRCFHLLTKTEQHENLYRKELHHFSDCRNGLAKPCRTEPHLADIGHCLLSRGCCICRTSSMLIGVTKF